MKKIILSIVASVLLGVAMAQQTQIKYLSGIDKDHTVNWNFFCTDGQNSGKWSKIPVPCNWEQQGFGNYNYGQDKIKSSEQGLYKYEFSTETGFKGKLVFIVFEGSMTDTEVKINGRIAGDVHQGSFYRFKYDITNLLKPSGKNLLEVKVSKTSANQSVNRAERNGDFWILGGIFRPVYLEITPQTFIERLTINAKTNGAFFMDVYCQNLTEKESISAQVQTLAGVNVGKPFTAKGKDAVGKLGILPDSAGILMLNQKFVKPLLWSSEFPNLYQVVVSIKNNKGIIHQIKQQFGFRTAELRLNDGFYINDAKIMFKGVNRHSFWPESGRTLSHAIHVMDVKLIKEMNMNAVRMSHYPPDEDFIHVCDSLGLYVLDEVTGWHGAYDTIAGEKIVKEMVTRDVNHPSVVMWDNGNEGGWNTGLDGNYALYDPQKRLVIHPWTNFNGANTKHYPDYAYMLKSVATEKDVFFPTEFMHGLYDGGAGAGLDDFWNLMLKHPHSAGGFIWALLDEALVRTDKSGELDTDGNHAPDGIVGPHREKEASFYTIKEIWSPVYIDLKQIDAKFNGTVSIQNRYSFTNLKQCSFKWKLQTLPLANDKDTRSKTVASGLAISPDVKPGANGILRLNLPAKWLENDLLELTAIGADGKEIYSWNWSVKPSQRPKPAVKNIGNITNKETDTELIVNCGLLTYYFDKKTGYIEKVTKPGASISLSGGPVLAGVNCELKQFAHRTTTDGYVVEANYEGVNGKLNVKWQFTASTLVRLDYQYTQTGDAEFIGISFNYPEDKITGMKWNGSGPFRVWKNRLKGQQLGVWHKNYNNAITGETFGYPEFKGYHANVNWVVIENKESPFTVYTDNKDMYFQMLRPAREKAALKNNNVEPSFPEGSIGFLSAISAIGTKFQPAKVMGPQSQKTIPTTEPFSGTLWFNF